LGITKNKLANGCKSEDGSYIFTDIESLRKNTDAIFSVTIDQDTYSGIYQGLLAIDADKNGIKKLAATALKQLSKNGTVIFELDRPTDVFIETKDKKRSVTLVDKTKKIKPMINKL
jgi:hypothetical protein